MEENKKRGNCLTIILFILLLIAVGVICYLLGSNSAKDNSNNNDIPTEEKDNNPNSTIEQEKTITPVSYSPKCVEDNQANLKVDIDETKYNNIVDYIKTQQNVKIKLSYCVGDEIEQSDYILSENEKNIALSEISSHYIENTGLGGGACVPTTEISYTRNNSSYFVKYFGNVMSSNDGNIYKIIDKTVTVTQPSEDACHYFVQSLGSTINNITKYER